MRNTRANADTPPSGGRVSAVRGTSAAPRGGSGSLRISSATMNPGTAANRKHVRQPYSCPSHAAVR